MLNTLLKSQIGRLRMIAFIEGLSFLIILFITMPLKYMFDTPEPNKVVGMLHGLFSVLYVLATFTAKINYDWNWKTTSIVLFASIIPFGTFYIDSTILKKQMKKQ